MHLANSVTVPGWNIGCEWDTVIWKCQRSGTRDILPLRGWSTAYVNINHRDFLSNTKCTQATLSYFASHIKREPRQSCSPTAELQVIYDFTCYSPENNADVSKVHTYKSIANLPSISAKTDFSRLLLLTTLFNGQGRNSSYWLNIKYHLTFIGKVLLQLQETRFKAQGITGSLSSDLSWLCSGRLIWTLLDQAHQRSLTGKHELGSYESLEHRGIAVT